ASRDRTRRYFRAAQALSSARILTAPPSRLSGWCAASRIDIGKRQRSPCLIFGRDRRRARERPCDAKRGIAPQQGALEFRIPVIGRLVEKLCGVRDHQEAVSEACWDP